MVSNIHPVAWHIPRPLKSVFKQVPKTDLHVHTRGSTRRRDLKTFMQEHGVSDNEIIELMNLVKPVYDNFTELTDLGGVYHRISRHVYTPSQYRRATFGIVQEAAKDNVKILAPRTSLLNKGGEPKEIVEAVEEGLREGAEWVHRNHGYNMRSYVTISAERAGTKEDSLQTAKLAIELAQRPNSMIRSFDLAGDESKYSIDKHEDALRHIKKEGPLVGVKLETHAGETKMSGNTTGAESIRKAIEYGTDSLAHALRLMDDDKLRRFVIDNKIPVQMPTWSHVQVKVVDSYPAHPIKSWLEEGMKINLVTDNRFLSQITLRKQLGQLWANDLITTWDQIKQLTINGIEAAFLSESEKQEALVETLEEFAELEKRFCQAIKAYLD